jgi:AbrB family looped-hinge helix DNA binding protein
MSVKGQIVVPAEVRKRLGMGAGTWIRVEEQDGKLLLTSLGDDLIKATYGMARQWGSESLTEELLKERALDCAREEAGLPPPRRRRAVRKSA